MDHSIFLEIENISTPSHFLKNKKKTQSEEDKHKEVLKIKIFIDE